MNYHQRNKKNAYQPFFAVLGLCAVLLLLYVFFKTSMHNSLVYMHEKVASLFISRESAIKVVSIDSYNRALQIENQQLKEILGRSVVNNEDITIDEEVASSTATTTGTTTHQTTLLKAKEKEIVIGRLGVITSRPPHIPYDTLTIDIGSLEGVLEGDYAYASGKFLIGKVSAVLPHTSTIVLFSSPTEKVDALIGASSTPATLEGRGGGNFYTKIPKDVQINVGDPIYFANIKTIVLGTVEKVNFDEGGAYSYIYFTLPVNVHTLRFVEIK